MANEGLVVTNTVLITIVFIIVAILFLFPSNRYIPLDRRMAGLIGSAFCTLIIWIFPTGERNNTLNDIDVQVLLVLIAIMGINFVVMRQPSVETAIHKLQNQIRHDPNSGFWLVSFVSFIVSPFIMNDGLCLLLVNPVLDAFCAKTKRGEGVSTRSSNFCETDPFYFMLAICCSANIGSATTFSGNPQNLIIAQYLDEYMNCGLFFGILIVPAIGSWLATTLLINYFRIAAAKKDMLRRETILDEPNSSKNLVSGGEIELNNLVSSPSSSARGAAAEDNDRGSSDSPLPKTRRQLLSTKDDIDLEEGREDASPLHEGLQPVPQVSDEVSGRGSGGVSPVDIAVMRHRQEKQQQLQQPELPVETDEEEEGSGDSSKSHLIEHAPLPSGSLSLIAAAFFIALITLEFVGVFELAPLFTIIAITLIGAVLLINYYRGYPHTHHNGRPYTNEERINGISAYIEELFLELDYNILIIFTGLFIVSGSFVHTGIPAYIWKAFAGDKPFTTAGSIVLISIYVSIASQLVGNVPVVYMAQNQVSELSPKIQKLGWCIMAWVSTVAGNLTLTGSAANIIVAEKAARYNIDFVVMKTAYVVMLLGTKLYQF